MERKDIVGFARMLNPAEGELKYFTIEQMTRYPGSPEVTNVMVAEQVTYVCRRFAGRVQVVLVDAAGSQLPADPVWDDAELDLPASSF